MGKSIQRGWSRPVVFKWLLLELMAQMSLWKFRLIVSSSVSQSLVGIATTMALLISAGIFSYVGPVAELFHKGSKEKFIAFDSLAWAG